MQVRELALPGGAILQGALIFAPGKVGDERGFFSETFRQSVFEAHVPGVALVQDNHSFSAPVGVLRGLHFQKPPFDQGKLVRVTSGRVLDVIVDIRKGSPTFGRHAAVDLSRENWRQLWVPSGFAHGFVTLEPHTEFLYRCSNYYAPTHDAGLVYNDPDLAIAWPVANLTLSAKDRVLPRLRDIDSPFIFEA